MELPEKPRYGIIAVSDDLTLNFDVDDTWVSINCMWADECSCVMVGLSEIEQLIQKLQEVKPLLEKNLSDIGSLPVKNEGKNDAT